MKHLGDITKISGYTAPIVDCIIGGSPCQDLSMAGKRAGLDGERSGLYIEQVRIAKEMRKQDELNGRSDVDIRPRYMVWENVPGAFSSNKGEDFRIVLEELAKVKDENAVIPMPDKGKWTNSGCIVGRGHSIAWRVLDSQWWGVPQRRRRIALVADFNGYTAQRILFNELEFHGSTKRDNNKSSVGNIGGASASEILFVRKSVSGDSDESEPKRKEASSDASGGIGADDSIGVDIYNTALTGDKACPLTAGGYGSTGTCPKVMTPVTFEPGIASREGGHIYEGVSGTLRANAGDNQMATAYTLKIRSGCEGGGKGALVQEDKSATLATNNDQYLFQPIGIIDSIGGNAERAWWGDTAPCLKARDYKFAPSVAYSVENHPADSRVDIDESGKVQTLTSRMRTGGGNVPMVMQCFSKQRRAKTSTDFETWKESETANTLNVFDVGDVRTTEAVVYALDRASFNQGKNAQFNFEVSDNGINSSLVAKGPGAVCYSTNHGTFHTQVEEGICATLQATDYKDPPTVTYCIGNGQAHDAQRLDKELCKTLNCMGNPMGICITGTRYIVRRLTPLECERLQGFPDNWTQIGEVVGYERQIDDITGEEYVQAIYEYIDANGKKRKTSDSARYKALGNSIALPPWKWVLKRLCACYERDATMASLFDGIGGFPLIWEQLNGKGSCLWASEIEEFPIAVTKARIGD